METITAEEKKAQLAQNIVYREREVHGYQANIDNYTQMLKTLPKEWPAALLQFKGMSTEQMIENVPLESLQAVIDLNFRDVIEKRVKAEMIEQRKSMHVYDAMVAQVDSAELPDMLAAAKAKIV